MLTNQAQWTLSAAEGSRRPIQEWRNKLRETNVFSRSKETCDQSRRSRPAWLTASRTNLWYHKLEQVSVCLWSKKQQALDLTLRVSPSSPQSALFLFLQTSHKDVPPKWHNGRRTFDNKWNKANRAPGHQDRTPAVLLLAERHCLLHQRGNSNLLHSREKNSWNECSSNGTRRRKPGLNTP